MRRGWKPEWDWVERWCWTTVAFVWAFDLAGVLALVFGARILNLDAARDMGSGLLYTFTPCLLLATVFVYVGLWLRRKLLPPPPTSGRDRDR